ncbi:MAG: hypothetical protein IPP72_22360 [Chitinophagaceae bacterium]|nr:hypothetical protein [Chitinophagaceae bacterium]
MSRPVANWHHLLLDYGTDSTGNNINIKQLAARLNVTGYPAFFLLDKTGIIKATPASAVAYIQSAGKKEHPFLKFLILPATWQRYYWVLVLSLLAYGAILMALNKLLPKNNRV